MSDMTSAQELASGKGHTNENFPVASALIAKRHRPIVMAFYRFARAADDVADHPSALPEQKLQVLEAMRATLVGESDVNPEAVALRAAQIERGVTAQHGLDLLEAFRRDVTKLRYADWADLIDYCRYSAAPVGRFVLDVHGEARSTWALSDPLCAALQVINHLQDCARDYRQLDRVYIPLDALHAAGIGVEALGEPAATPALRGVIRGLAERTAGLLDQSRPFARAIRDRRLGVEVAVIQRLAERLNARLIERDPLSEKVHHSGLEALAVALAAALGFWFGRAKASSHAPRHAEAQP